MPAPRQYSSNAERQKAYRTRQEQSRLDLLASKNLPALPSVPTIPGTTRWIALHDQAKASLQTIIDEMQAYYDDRTEQWQESDRGQAFQEKIDEAEEARSTLDNLDLS